MNAPDAESIFYGGANNVVLDHAQLGDLFGTPAKPKKFKIRITSKSSGKMFDLNLNFIHKKLNIDLLTYIEKEFWASAKNSSKEPQQVVSDTSLSKKDIDKALSGHTPNNLSDKPY